MFFERVVAVAAVADYYDHDYDGDGEKCASILRRSPHRGSGVLIVVWKWKWMTMTMTMMTMVTEEMTANTYYWSSVLRAVGDE